MSDWQRIGDVPVDTGRLVLVDPMNLDDVSRREADEPGSATYELVTNEHGVAVALVILDGPGRRALSGRGAFRGGGGSHADRRGPGPVPSPPGDRLRAAPMMRVCLRAVPQRRRSWTEAPSRCAVPGAWSNPPPANAYAYGSGWQAVRKRVLERDGSVPAALRRICVGEPPRSITSSSPRPAAADDLANLRAVCVRCHARRTGRQGALAKQRKEQRAICFTAARSRT